MISAANTAVADGVVSFSWQELGSGDVATQLGKLTGPCVQELDQRTRVMTEFNDNFDKFIAAAQSQGVMDLLKGPGPFTLLVPVDSSVSKNVDAKAHVLQGKISYEDLKQGGTAQTLAGTTIEYRKALKTVKVEDASVKAIFNAADHRGGKLSTAFPFDVECTNGVIHAIDEPLGTTDGPVPQGAPASQAAPAAPSGTSSFAAYMASRGAAPAAASAPGGALPKTGVWDFATKKLYYDAWDPEKPRDYNNFNPFERNDESAMADMSGCFPGQSRGYKSPIRPDMDWAKMQEDAKLMDALKQEAKFNIKGRPGNFHLKWQDNLGAPP
jgi:uncharacterized surface protein with fasciclin (FAS1) repeats